MSKPLSRTAQARRDWYVSHQTDWMREVGLRKGDIVRVTGISAGRRNGWNNDWMPAMDMYVGKPMTVLRIHPSCGITLMPGGYDFPFFSLKWLRHGSRNREKKYDPPYEGLGEAIEEAEAKAKKKQTPFDEAVSHVILNKDGTWEKLDKHRAGIGQLEQACMLVHMASGVCTKNRWGRAYSTYPTWDKVVTRKLSWDEYFLDIAATVSTKSKDTSTPVGAVIVGEDHQILSTGFNGFPRGVQDDPELVPERYERPMKYSYTVHAEPNSLLNAAMHGIALKGATMYIYGYPPCDRCAAAMRQAGIVRVVVRQVKPLAENWKESCDIGKKVLAESGVVMQILDPQGRQLYWCARGFLTEVPRGWID